MKRAARKAFKPNTGAKFKGPFQLTYSTEQYAQTHKELERRLQFYDKLSPRMRQVMSKVQPHIENLSALIDAYGEDAVIRSLEKQGLIR